MKYLTLKTEIGAREVTDLSDFVNSFKNTDEMFLCARLMSRHTLGLFYDALDDYLYAITEALDEMPLPHAKYWELDGILYDTTPEYDALEDLRSKTQEVFNVIEDVWDETINLILEEEMETL